MQKNNYIAFLLFLLFTVNLQVNGAEVKYEWDFGDNSPHSTVANPTHIYTSPGTYFWRMTSTAPNGDTCFKSGSITVTATAPAVTYDWNFGDGSPHSNEANPTHVYTSPGT
ncbi:MAG: PKD domain-containing protein, partial [Acidobacteria bacterium]|nr:PKD domain-containing protein [Acidobacteriota bacterium]